MALGIVSKTPVDATLSPGPLGPFQLQELINRGGMADVWIATCQDGSVAAFRCFRSADEKLNRTDRKRFMRGCEVLKDIHEHEFIIGYKEHGKIEGMPYLLMEFVESTNLKLLLSRSDDVLHEHVGNILIDMAEGLEYIHDQGYMHLDFKPENILVTPNGGVRVVDFDLTIPKPEKPKKTSDNPGTPAYMSPEQLLRKPFDHRADIFAFGVCAYELLTFRKPFPGAKPKEILLQELGQSDHPLIAPREINDSIPKAMEDVILKCLNKDPDQRYPYMSVLTRDLHRALYV